MDVNRKVSALAENLWNKSVTIIGNNQKIFIALGIITTLLKEAGINSPSLDPSEKIEGTKNTRPQRPFSIYLHSLSLKEQKKSAKP